MFILHTAEWIQLSLSKEVLAATLFGWQKKLLPKGPTWDRLLHPGQELLTLDPSLTNSVAMEQELLPHPLVWTGSAAALQFKQLS